MDDDARIRKLLREDFEHYARKCLKIRTKSGDIESLILNKAQKYANTRLNEQKWRTGKVRALILKGRQQGISTLIGGRFYHHTTHHKGIQTFILTHALDATDNLYEMAQRYYEKTPDLFKLNATVNNRKKLIFGSVSSGYRIGTAENKSAGRSSTIQLFHGSEVAFWTNAAEHAKGILQAIPDMPGTEVILESTANGVGNYFHQMWQKAEADLNDYQAIFIPWFWQDEYQREVPPDFRLNHIEEQLKEVYGLTDNQLAWRRYKIIDLSINGQDGERAFCQEYPCNAQEAFQLTGENTFIQSSIVLRARKGKAEPYGPLLLGCDPARFGDDRTSFIFRQGRVAFGLQSYVKKDTMEVTGILHRLYLEHKPEKIFIDLGGLGAGVFDRAKELIPGDIVVAVNGGESPYDAKKYKNKRAEMWGLAKEWLYDIPVQIPDTDSFQADLCGIKYKYDSNSRLQMEDKAEMKARGIRSPDEADAFCNTFALPQSYYIRHESPTRHKVKSLAQDFNTKFRAIQKSRK